MARIETDPNYSSPTFSRATAATDLFKKEDVQALAAAMSTHDHTTGKGLPMAAGSIPNGTITSAMIADLTIDTADLKDGAVTAAKILDGAVTSAKILDGTIVGGDIASLTITGVKIADAAIATAKIGAHQITQIQVVHGITSSPTTTSTTGADIPDLAIAMTCTGGDVFVLVVCGVYTATPATFVSVGITMDAGGVLQSAQPTIPANAHEVVAVAMYLHPALAAGVHTWRGRWSVQSGATATAAGTRRSLMVVELMR
jgi:hypothetical protein